ncbi:hypothetical protein AGMMS4952_02740 [Spirochaetia bacterium]|nr:hypothetical protein AGMMS4952_02740 [Spirochaetia bacterium]
MESMNKRGISTVFVLLFILLSGFLFINRGNITWKPWITEAPLEWLGYANGNGKLTAIIADSAKTVVVIDEDGKLQYRLRSKGKSPASFTSAELVDIDEENNLYVYDQNFGGAFEENNERVLKYSPKGKFLGEVYSYQYTNEDFIITKGKISGIACSGRDLYLVRIERNGFYLDWASTEGPRDQQTIVFFPYPDAFRELSYCRINIENERIVFTSKAGVILEYSFRGTLTNQIREEDGHFPYMAVSGNEGQFIYNDIINNTIVSLNQSAGTRTELLAQSDDEDGFYYYINYKNGIFYASYNSNDIFIMDKAEHKTIDSYSYLEKDILFRWFLFALCIIGTALLFLLFIPFLNFLSKRKPSETLKRIMLVGVCILFGAGISSVLIINEMNNQYNANTYNGLENISRIIAASIDTEALQAIQSPADFDMERYRKLSESIKTAFTGLQFDRKQVYINIWMERNGVVYSMYDLEYALGTFYPYALYEDSFLEKTITEKAYDYDQVLTSSGMWMNVSGPIMDSTGEAVAAIEIGYNMRMVEEHSRNMIIQTALIVLAATVALLLILIEAILILAAYKNNKSEMAGNKLASFKPGIIRGIITLLTDAYKRNKPGNKAVYIHPGLHGRILSYLVRTYKNSRGVAFHPELLRAASFLMYFSANFATALLPMYAARLYTPLFTLPKEFIVTLPFTAQVIFTVIALFLGPIVLERAGIKRVSLVSAVLFVLGNVLCFIAVNTLHLSAGYGLLGFSGGIFVLIFNTIIGAQKKIEDVNSGFAHFNASYLAGVNVGVVFGSIIAQFFPYRTVFCFASIMSLAFLLVIIFSVRSKLVNHIYDIQYEKEEDNERFALLKFVSNPVVFCTMVFLLLPYVVSMSFAEYFMPIFGTENGLSESNVGQLILLSGLLAILFGTSLCEFASKKIPLRVIIFFSLLIDAGAIFLFSINASVPMLVVAIVLIAVSNIFALTNIQTLFTTLYQGRRVSSIKAQSTYSAVENISMAIGPVVFSYILSKDISVGMKLFAAAMVASLIIFFVVFTIFGKKKAADAIKIDSMVGADCFQRGNEYWIKGEYDSAIADFTQAISIIPNYALAYGNRGVAYGKKGEYDLAIADFTQAISIVPNYAMAHGNRGIAYWKKGDINRAIADFTRALQIDPGTANIKQNLDLARKQRRN